MPSPRAGIPHARRVLRSEEEGKPARAGVRVEPGARRMAGRRLPNGRQARRRAPSACVAQRPREKSAKTGRRAPERARRGPPAARAQLRPRRAQLAEISWRIYRRTT